jgi:hypothetical protein
MAADPPEALERFRAYRHTGDPAIRNGLVEDHLLWAWDIAALGTPMRAHASARLAKV